MRSLLLLFTTVIVSITGTPLDDYVNKPDPAYNWTIIDVSYGENYTLYNLNMTSQAWGKGYVTNQDIWWHYVNVIIPNEIKHPDIGYIFADEGTNRDPPGSEGPFVFPTALMGVSLGVVSVEVRMIPNEPLYFSNDPHHKSWSETSLLAWTIMTYLNEDQDPLKLALLPMTKACVRAMDAAAELAKMKNGLNINKFLVSGMSKRSWAAWLTAVVDKRVIALAPVVYDLLNMIESLHHMYRAYGGWSFALKSFYRLNFTAVLDTPQALQLQAIVDPISYVDRLTMPKLVIDTTGDEYFMLDNPHYYFDKMKGPMYFDTIANADHLCVGHIMDIVFAQRAFFQHVINNVALPKLTWKVEKKSNSIKLTVFTDKVPKFVKSFYAMTVDNRRDFRLIVASPEDPMNKVAVHPVVWFEQPVHQESTTEFWVENTARKEWTGFFIQVSYAGVEDTVLELTTPTQIVPDTFPFSDCHGDACRGTIV